MIIVKTSVWQYLDILLYISVVRKSLKCAKSTFVQKKQIFVNFVLSLPNKTEKPLLHSSQLRVIIESV